MSLAKFVRVCGAIHQDAAAQRACGLRISEDNHIAYSALFYTENVRTLLRTLSSFLNFLGEISWNLFAVETARNYAFIAEMLISIWSRRNAEGKKRLIIFEHPIFFAWVSTSVAYIRSSLYSHHRRAAMIYDRDRQVNDYTGHLNSRNLSSARRNSCSRSTSMSDKDNMHKSSVIILITLSICSPSLEMLLIFLYLCLDKLSIHLSFLFYFSSFSKL